MRRVPDWTEYGPQPPEDADMPLCSVCQDEPVEYETEQICPYCKQQIVDGG